MRAGADRSGRQLIEIQRRYVALRFPTELTYWVEGDRARFPSGSSLPMHRSRSSIPPGGDLQFIDDFEIADERVWLGQFSTLRVLGLPGESKLVVADLKGNVQCALDPPFIPSSTVYAVDTMFGPLSIVLTSCFDGGPYRVTFE